MKAGNEMKGSGCRTDYVLVVPVYEDEETHLKLFIMHYFLILKKRKKTDWPLWRPAALPHS